MKSGYFVKIPVFQKMHFWNLQVMGIFRIQKISHTNTIRDLILPLNYLLRGYSLKRIFRLVELTSAFMVFAADASFVISLHCSRTSTISR